MAGESYHLNAKKRGTALTIRALSVRRGQMDEPTANEAEG